MKRLLTTKPVALFAAVVLAGAFISQAGASGSYSLLWSTVGGGGATLSSASYAVGSTIGEPAAGNMAGTSLGASGGFWGGRSGTTLGATSTPTVTASPIPSPTASGTPTPSPSPAGTPTPSSTATGTASPTSTATRTASPTPPTEGTATPTPTATVSGVRIPFRPGWNLIARAAVDSRPHTASSLVVEFREHGIIATHVARWEDGSWESYIPGFPLNDFPIELGRGYFVRATDYGIWTPEITSIGINGNQ